MNKLYVLLFGLFTIDAFAVCSSPISRTNNSANAVLTSTKYNLDLNTVYSKVNDLPGDCITDETISTSKLADGAVTSEKLAAGVLSQFIPSGTILPFGGTVAPSGFFLCNGQAVSRTDYSDLYDAIGTNFGSGNGSTTFNVPDLRGRFLRGVDGGAGNDPDRATRTAMNSGGNAGDNVGSVQDDGFALHGHPYRTGSSGSSTDASGGFAMELSNQANHSAYTGTPTADADELLGGSGGNETRPVNANVNFIIKY